MRWDRRRHFYKLWKEANKTFNKLQESFISVGLAANLAGDSISKMVASSLTKGQLYYCTDTNEVFVWDGRMWERVRDY